jgi:CubicO group peptidase (beta-lactamase class C family)
MTLPRRAVLAALVLALGLAWAPAVATGTPRDREKVLPANLAELETEIREVLRETKTPGAGVALVTRDGVVWEAGLGLADVASGRPATPDTLFRIGSVTKGLVALSVLMLVEEGKLHLDDPLRPLAPDVFFENPWEATQPVRVVHLLEHTTGFDDWSFREYASSDPRPLTLQQGLDYAPRSRVSRWPPGTRMAYCNSGPPLAAHVVERLTGMPFEEFVQRRIFDPLGMPSATFLDSEAVRSNGATLYHPDGVTPYPYWHVLMRPAGSVNASAREMGRYLRMYLNRGTLDGQRLVSPASIDRMEVPQTTDAARAGLRIGYGLGNYANVKGGFVLHGHDGGMEGGLARVTYLPELGLGWVILLNASSTQAMKDIDTLVRNTLTRDLPRPAPPPLATVSPETRQAFSGWYVTDSPRMELFHFLDRLLGPVHLRFTGQGLVLRTLWGKRKEYLPVTDRLYREKDDPAATLVLLDTPGGSKVGQSFGSLARVASPRIWLQSGLLVLSLLAMASAVLFALVWVPRWLFGRLRRAPAIAVRVFPLLSVLLLVGSAALVMVSGDDILRRFGRPTPWSVGFMLGTLGFALASALSLILAFGPRSRFVGRGVRWHTRAVALACGLCAATLGAAGMLGLQTWR